MNDKRVSKTLYNLVLKIKKLKLKRKVENADETTKVRKKLVENLMKLHAKSFEFATSIVNRIAILVNVTKKDQNLFRNFEVVEFFFAINVDVIRSVIENAINDEDDIMLRSKVMIDIDEQTVLNFQQSIEKCEIFVLFFCELIRRRQLAELFVIVAELVNDDKIDVMNKKQINKNVLTTKNVENNKKKIFFFRF